jgi:DnaK suppressor protein
MEEAELKAIRLRLVAQREELRQMAAASEESRKPVELDQTTVGRLSRMDAMQLQAMALEAERRRVAELKRIDAALRRIEEGEYGYCTSCGDEIPAKRLEIDLTIPNCVKCAAERSGIGPGSKR